MAQRKTEHVCTECGTPHPKWGGQCAGCGAWNTLVEEVVQPAAVVPLVGLAPASPPLPIGEVDPLAAAPQATGIGELDRVLGGGLVPGSVTLLGGEPGVGKSTLLLLQLLAGWPGRALYVTAEESAQQVRLRAERLDAVRPELWLYAETSLPAILQAVADTQPGLVVVDSIQTVADPALGSAPGSVTQVRECASQLVTVAKRTGVAVILVGHVTKDGALAGPRVLEHVVDTVLSFEGDRHHALRTVRATKHRFGPTADLGLFEMVGEGLLGVPDAGALLLGDRRAGASGSVVAASVEGHRPLTVEVQALTNKGLEGVPSGRTAQGLDRNRLTMLLAVLQQHAGVPTGSHDVYASTAGGLRLTEPGLDLAVCLAVASSIGSTPVAPGLVAFGEVGLTGELRQVAQPARRLAEAARLGFRRAIVPARTPADASVDGLELVRVATLADALSASGVSLPTRR
jgi:DNA repair protein RadA/Sms